MHKKSVTLLFITLSSPIMIGVYENSELIESLSSEEKSSDVLPLLVKSLFEKYDIKGLYYTSGPGSFMAIKITYIFLKSLSILHKIPLFATDAFYFNKNQPIKAIGKLYFVKIDQEIVTKKFEDTQTASFALPEKLDYNKFSTNAEPLYIIGAV